MSSVGMRLTNDSAHWLAGLLEGEGSFMKGPYSSPNLPIVKVEMCDEDVIRRAAGLLGASVSIIDRQPERGHKRVFRAQIQGLARRSGQAGDPQPDVHTSVRPDQDRAGELPRFQGFAHRTKCGLIIVVRSAAGTPSLEQW